jgi:glucose-6-phosphate isomerase
MKYSKTFYPIKSNEMIYNLVSEEIKSIGYYSLPFQDTSAIKEYAKNVNQKDIVVVGIGGSSLGTYAIHKFLKQKLKKQSHKKLHFLESTDPIDLQHRMNKIDFDDAMFIIISKSGNTVETTSILKYINENIELTKENCTIISEDDSSLTAYANEYNMHTFSIPKDVGGRFSVFSNVGLVPLACIGVDIDQLLKGCQKIYNSFFTKNEFYMPIMEKARFMVENKNRFNINILFSYSSLLEGFNKWYIQLWGESLGKLNINKTRQALTPVALLGPIDQHSFLQLIIDGVRDKTVTFIKVEDFGSDMKIPKMSLKHMDRLDYLNGIKFQDLINHQANATIASVEDLKDVPCDTIIIEKVDEYNIAKLMFTYQLLTSIIGKFLQINTYDQPGVEDGKTRLELFLKS